MCVYLPDISLTYRTVGEDIAFQSYFTHQHLSCELEMLSLDAGLLRYIVVIPLHSSFIHGPHGNTAIMPQKSVSMHSLTVLFPITGPFGSIVQLRVELTCDRHEKDSSRR